MLNNSVPLPSHKQGPGCHQCRCHILFHVLRVSRPSTDTEASLPGSSERVAVRVTLFVPGTLRFQLYSSPALRLPLPEISQPQVPRVRTGPRTLDALANTINIDLDTHRAPLSDPKALGTGVVFSISADSTDIRKPEAYKQLQVRICVQWNALLGCVL